MFPGRPRQKTKILQNNRVTARARVPEPPTLMTINVPPLCRSLGQSANARETASSGENRLEVDEQSVEMRKNYLRDKSKSMQYGGREGGATHTTCL